MNSLFNEQIRSIDIILSVVTHDRVQGLVGLQIFASDGKQQVFIFAQIEQASGTGHGRHGSPFGTKTVQLQQESKLYKEDKNDFNEN